MTTAFSEATTPAEVFDVVSNVGRPDPVLEHVRGRGSVAPAVRLQDGDLLDVPLAHYWFDHVNWMGDHSSYTYQLPLHVVRGASGQILDQEIIQFSSYSYSGLNGHPRIIAAAQSAATRYGTSPGGARILTGTLTVHLDLERELARFLGIDGVATFSSGFDANLAAVTSLLGPRDVAILDELAHRSLVNGVRLAGCARRRFRHNDLTSLQEQLDRARKTGAPRVMVIVEGVYSMDGDMAPLAELVKMVHDNGAFLLLDESHAIAAIGATGRGTCEVQGVDPRDVDIITGSLGKGIPSSGGFVGGARGLKLLMQHGADPSIFSGALSPMAAAAALEALLLIDEEPSHLASLRRNTLLLREGLTDLGLIIGGVEQTPVVPLALGSTLRTLTWSRILLDHGISASAITAPAVSDGQERLRLCATGAHTPKHFEQLFAGLRACLAAESLSQSSSVGDSCK